LFEHAAHRKNRIGLFFAVQSGIRIRVLKNRKDDPHHPGLVILRHHHVLLLLLPLYDLLLDEEGGDGVVDDLL
jgi:hypothetical protein